ncbi:hypothetical protein Adt_40412 [Abeliophyllum distichum]|uniref:Uncharacterized protein n=1 Tax=Abeliophyllum distichum TaxID=126358 RepID=A0ABD1Q7Y8_9LAMI
MFTRSRARSRAQAQARDRPSLPDTQSNNLLTQPLLDTHSGEPSVPEPPKKTCRVTQSDSPLKQTHHVAQPNNSPKQTLSSTRCNTLPPRVTLPPTESDQNYVLPTLTSSVTQSHNHNVPPSPKQIVSMQNPPGNKDYAIWNYILFALGAVLTFAASVVFPDFRFFHEDICGYILGKMGIHVGKGFQNRDQIILACSFSTLIHLVYFCIMWKIHPWMRRRFENNINVQVFLRRFFSWGLFIAVAYIALYFKKTVGIIYFSLLSTSFYLFLASYTREEDFSLLELIR